MLVSSSTANVMAAKGGIPMKTFTRLAGVSVLIVMLVLAGCDHSAPTTSGPDVTLIPPPSASVTGGAGGPAYPIGTTVSQAVATAPATTPVAVAQATATPAPNATTAGQVQGFPYVVQIGDTLQSIAARFNTTVEVLRAMNNLSGDQVTVGQQLVIPGTAPAPQNQPAANPTPTARPTTAPATTSPRTVRYVVKAGDRLYRIGLRYGVTWAVIARFNGIRNP